MRMPLTGVAGRDVDEGRDLLGKGTPFITVSGTKWMLDGTPDEGTFAPRDDRRAVDVVFKELGLTFPNSELSKMLDETLQSHDQALFHVSGYPAAKSLLHAMMDSGGPAVWKQRRVRIEHGDGLLPDLLPAAKQLGVVVIQNPQHFTGLPSALVARLSAIHAQPLKSLLQQGIPLGLGSDDEMNPYLDIMLATSHPNDPSEAITREQAVKAYTLTSAFAESTETDKGSLEPGKLADLAVLSQDIFVIAGEELPKTQSILTIVGGKVVYDNHLLVAAR